MGKTKIEWTHKRREDGTLMPGYTFNPWWGCVKVSEGCKNCYAETMANRFGDWWGKNATRRFFGDKHWNEPSKWNKKAGELRERHKVFCGSMCDVFEDREDLWLHQERLFKLIHQTPYLDWLLLTKRPENIKKLWDKMFAGEGLQVLSMYGLDNVWLGVTVENQEQARIRIPQLIKIPAKIRFLSCEPLLENLDITGYLWDLQPTGAFFPYPSEDYQPMGEIDWVIAGGESGQRRRPMNLDWARSLRDQCKEADIPFFFKQIDKIQPIPEDLMIQEFPNDRGI